MNTSVLSVVALSIGASLGAFCRWQLGLWLNPPVGVVYAFPHSLPWGTWVVNVLGGLLIGVGVGLLQAMPDINPLWRLVWMTGFLGAFTTFSAFSAEVVAMLMVQQYGLALLTASAHVLGSLAATALGLALVQAVR